MPSICVLRDNAYIFFYEIRNIYAGVFERFIFIIILCPGKYYEGNNIKDGI